MHREADLVAAGCREVHLHRQATREAIGVGIPEVYERPLVLQAHSLEGDAVVPGAERSRGSALQLDVHVVRPRRRNAVDEIDSIRAAQGLVEIPAERGREHRAPVTWRRDDSTSR